MMKEPLKRSPVRKVEIDIGVDCLVQYNGNNTWTAVLLKPYGNGNPYTANNMDTAIQLCKRNRR